MHSYDPQHWAPVEVFDPDDGIVIRRPPSEGAGYWVGAPGVMYDRIGEAFYLTYRVRRPRGVEPDRGAEVHLARSVDGVEFDTIWSGNKSQLGTTSIERCAIRRLGEDCWVLYISYVDPADGRWRIDSVQAASPEAFDLTAARPLLTAADVGVEGVKDPFVFQVAGLYHMVISYATVEGQPSADDLHGTNDAYNTGLIRSATGLATSYDGLDWQWQGNILSPSSDGWDQYCARIGCVWRQNGIWLALYDGSASVEENYEERVALAYSYDLRSFQKVNVSAPLMTTKQVTGAMRYFDVLQFADETYFYYEMARDDGSHDLRVYRQGR